MFTRERVKEPGGTAPPDASAGGSGGVRGGGVGVLDPLDPLDPLDALVGSASVLARMDWDSLGGDAQLDLVSCLERAHRVLGATLAVGLAAVDRGRSAERVSELSASAWVARSLRGCGGEAARRVRLGYLIGRFECLGAAVLAGELSVEHVGYLDGVNDSVILQQLVESDEELTAAAMRMTLAEWRREIRTRVTILRDENAAAAAAAAAAEEAAEAAEAARGGHETGAPEREPTDTPGATGGHDASGGDGASGSNGASDGCGVSGTDGAPGGSAGSPGSGSNGAAGSAGGPGGGSGGGPLFDSPDGSVGAAGAASGDVTGALSWLSVRTTAEGGLWWRGEFFGEPAEFLRQAIEAEASRQRRIAWAEHSEHGTEMPTAGQLRACALIELVRRGAAVGVEHSHAPRSEAVIVIEADDLAARRVRTLEGEPVTAEVAALLACDAFFQALVVDRSGQPLWLSRSARLASAAQRKALAVRDGGCVFPTCDMPPSWCDAHHQPGWHHGGTTDIDTMALLCRRHHGTAHSNRWTLRPAPSEPGAPETRKPDQRPPPHVPPGTGPPGARSPGSRQPDHAGPPRAEPSGAAPADTEPSASQQPEARSVSDRGRNQRFEWINHTTGAITPARQRGLR